MQTFKYCLPIIEDSKEKVLAKISENPDYNFYEIWLAYIKDLDIDFVWKISEEFNGNLIFLFRKQNLEKSDLGSEEKQKIIELLESSGNFLDLDIHNQKEELDFIKKEKLKNKLVTSFHDYQETGRMDELKKTIEQMEEFKPVIVKVSSFCKNPEDSIKLLTLLLELKKEGRKFIILGMGEEGKIVRIYGALWGNEFNFAPVEENEKSADGQLTKMQLERILEEIQ